MTLGHSTSRILESVERGRGTPSPGNPREYPLKSYIAMQKLGIGLYENLYSSRTIDRKKEEEKKT